MEIEEYEFDSTDPMSEPTSIEDIDFCLAMADKELYAHTGRAFPQWRSSQAVVPPKTVQIQTLATRIPLGPLFYPCSGRDIDEPIKLFSGSVSEFHFADPINPVKRITLEKNKRHKISQPKNIPHLGNVINQSGQSFGLRRLNENVVSHDKDGVLTLIDDISAISVFYYRGDSGGEGGSGQYWMGAVLLDLIMSRMISGGIICSDGSNSIGTQFEMLLGLAEGEHFKYRNLLLTRLPKTLPGKRMPMSVWQVFADVNCKS